MSNDDSLSGMVSPKTSCPHLADSVQMKSDWKHDVNAKCAQCGLEDENWVCLKCSTVCCGRFVNGHMLEHFTAQDHPLVLSYADLSSWCYKCEAYIDNPALSGIKRAAHKAKFGTDIPVSGDQA